MMTDLLNNHIGNMVLVGILKRALDPLAKHGVKWFFLGGVDAS